ncbi:unnamed protein product, partial [Thlaspi arvense]
KKQVLTFGLFCGGMVHEKGLVPQERNSDLFPSAINHVLINEYHPDQGIMPHQDGPAYFPVVIDFSPHLRLRSGDDGISRDQGSVAESCEPERNNHSLFSVLMMPRSLLIFKNEAYSDFLHGISDSPTQCYKQVQYKALFYL